MSTQVRQEIKVAIIGAGMAGLTAALRLFERGFKVTIYDERSYLGGKFGAHRDDLAVLYDRDGHDLAKLSSELDKGRLPERLKDRLETALPLGRIIAPSGFRQPLGEVSVETVREGQEWVLKSFGDRTAIGN